MRTGTFPATCRIAACVIATAALALVALAPASAAASDSGGDAGAPGPALPACVQVQSQARYVPYGYNHIVIVKNGCTKDASCTVSTDVNPQPQAAEVPKGTTSEVITFSASPSQAFVAKVTCKLH